MAIDFNTNAVINAVINAVKTQAGQGFSTISNLVSTQAKMMAHQAAFIAESSAVGALKDDPDLKQMFVDQLAGSVRGLAHTVAALTILTVEKVWNAVVKVLWQAINQALSSAGGGLLVLPAL